MDRAIECYRLFLRGDNSGLEEIIRTYKDGLILYLNGYVRDLTLAEELTEETFVKLVIKRPWFSQQAAFKTWLYTIGRNVAIDHLRRNKRAELPLAECLQICNEEAGLEQRYIRQENKIAVHRSIGALRGAGADSHRRRTEADTGGAANSAGRLCGGHGGDETCYAAEWCEIVLFTGS